MTRTRWITAGLMIALMAGMSGLVYSQPGDPPAGPDRNRGESRREMRPEGRGDFRGEGRPEGRGDFRGDFRQRMNDRLKEALSASDEEWKVIQPRLEKVMMLTAQVRGGPGMMMMGNRPGRDGGPQADRPQTEVAKAAQELRTALEDKGTGNDTIKVKVEALRKAREKAKEELTKAQGELRDILNLRQESHLVMMGLLD